MRFRRTHLLAVFFTVLMCLVTPITAHADSFYVESQGITVEYKETPTKTVVVDKRGVLSEEQIQQIETAGEKLQIYDVGLYVEMTERANCSQSYANRLAEEKYAELMPRQENSVIVVFTFYEDAGGYYSVHYNLQGTFYAGEVNSRIRGTYHDFKTDSEWITGSFVQVVDYLSQVEYNLINADEIAAQKKAELIEVGKIFRIIFELVAIGVIIYLIVSGRKSSREYEEIIEKRDKKIDGLIDEARRQKQNCEQVQKKCRELEEWKENAIKSTPGVEENISKYLAKEVAKSFNAKYAHASSLEELDKMLTEYDDMSDEEKSYVKLDISMARKKLEKLAKDAAEVATKRITETCNCTGDRHNRAEFNDTMSYYNGLPTCVKILIAAQLIHCLNEKHSSAEQDYRNHSYSSHHSSSSSSSYSHMGGFHSGTFGGGFHGGH